MPDRINYPAAQRKSVVANMESGQRQADALERIAAALEMLCDKMYPAPAESASVESVLPMVEPSTDAPMENHDESGETSEV